MSDLKPCPNPWGQDLDSHKIRLELNDDGLWCWACSCGIQGPKRLTQSKATEAWNRRAQPDKRLVEAAKNLTALRKFCVCPTCLGKGKFENQVRVQVSGGMMSEEEPRYEMRGDGTFHQCWSCKGKGQAPDIWAAFEALDAVLRAQQEGE